MENTTKGQPQFIEGFDIFFGGTQVQQIVVQPASGQVFNGEIIEPLGFGAEALFLFEAPLQHDLVADRRGDRGINLLRGSFLKGYAVVTEQLIKDGFLNGIFVIFLH